MLILMPTGAMSQERRIERGIGPGVRPGKQSRLLWRSFTIKGEEFSVALPTFPTMTTRKTFQARVGKDRVERELKASADGVIYSITIFKNPEPRQSLPEFIAEQNANSGYDLATESNLNVNEFVGKQYSSPDKSSPATVQFFTTEGRLYRFTASGKVAVDDAVREFFSSISFGKKRAGVEVPNNPDERVFTGREADVKPVSMWMQLEYNFIP